MNASFYDYITPQCIQISLPFPALEVIAVLIDQLAFERSKEGFRHRVVPTISFATHAALVAVLLEQSLKPT